MITVGGYLPDMVFADVEPVTDSNNIGCVRPFIESDVWEDIFKLILVEVLRSVASQSIPNILETDAIVHDRPFSCSQCQLLHLEDAEHFSNAHVESPAVVGEL